MEEQSLHLRHSPLRDGARSVDPPSSHPTSPPKQHDLRSDVIRRRARGSDATGHEPSATENRNGSRAGMLGEGGHLARILSSGSQMAVMGGGLEVPSMLQNEGDPSSEWETA
jgi:hypothetical protein